MRVHLRDLCTCIGGGSTLQPASPCPTLSCYASFHTIDYIQAGFTSNLDMGLAVLFRVDNMRWCRTRWMHGLHARRHGSIWSPYSRLQTLWRRCQKQEKSLVWWTHRGVTLWTQPPPIPPPSPPAKAASASTPSTRPTSSWRRFKRERSPSRVLLHAWGCAGTLVLCEPDLLLLKSSFGFSETSLPVRKS